MVTPAVATKKLVAEVAVPPAVVTDIVPLVAVAGTVTVSDVVVAPVTVAVTPLNLTVLLAAVALKLVPVMVTDDPVAPEVGVKLDMVGVVPAAPTVKFVADVPVPPAVVTEMVPVVAVAGTVTVSDVAVALVTVAVTPLNLTVLLAAVALKLVPVMVTDDPVAPEVGVKLVIVGAAPVVAGTDRVNELEVPAQFLALIYKVVPAGTGVTAVQLSAAVPIFIVHVQLVLWVEKVAFV